VFLLERTGFSKKREKGEEYGLVQSKKREEGGRGMVWARAKSERKGGGGGLGESKKREEAGTPVCSFLRSPQFSRGRKAKHAPNGRKKPKETRATRAKGNTRGSLGKSIIMNRQGKPKIVRDNQY